MSSSRADQIREKVTQRHGIELLKKLEGLDRGDLAKLDAYDLAWHENTAQRNALIESKPLFALPLENSLVTVCEKFEAFIDRFGSEVLIPFQLSFVFELSVRDPSALIRSFQRARGTCDIVVFCPHTKAMFEAQELEYETYIFVDVDEG